MWTYGPGILNEVVTVVFARHGSGRAVLTRTQCWTIRVHNQERTEGPTLQSSSEEYEWLGRLSTERRTGIVPRAAGHGWHRFYAGLPRHMDRKRVET